MFIYCICTQYLVGAPFALITASIRRGMEVISLWHCWGGMEAQVSLTVAFSSSALLGLVSLIFLLTIPHRFSMILYGVQVRRVCWPIKHSKTMVIEPAFGTFGSVGRCQVLLENEISISVKLVSRRKHEVLLNFLVDGCVDCGLQKTQWTNTSRWHGSPNHHWLWKLHTGLQATWILCLSTLPPDSGTLISKWNAKFTFIWKEDFGPLSNSPVLFLHSPGKLLTLSLVQKWLCSPFPEDVWAWWLLMHWLQLQSTPCEALPSVWISFAWLYYKACGHPCCLCTFSYPNSSFQSTLHLICFDTALCKQPHL